MYRIADANAVLRCLQVLLFVCFCTQSNAQIIRTYAGGGVGDGGSAISAKLTYPSGVVIDAAGNLYIADSDNNRIRKVATNGTITTVAGNGTQGYSGDGGQAKTAELDYPSGVAIDAAGNLYIADYNNNRIRKVATNGTITTVAGNGTQGYSGDGGAATSAELYNPNGLAIDATGNLYIADFANHRIRKVATNGTITTVAGNGTGGYSGDGGPATSAELFYPNGVAIDAVGNLYIADFANLRIRKVATNGIISTVAGDGTPGYSGDGVPATSTGLYYPSGVAIDAGGNLYIADDGNNRIRKVATSGTITTVAGNGTQGYSGDSGPATSAELNSPVGVAIDAAGNVYVADTFNQRLRKVATNGTITTVAGTSDGHYGNSSNGGAATSAVLQSPGGVAIDNVGNVYIADTDDNVVRKVSANGIITRIAGTGLPGYSVDGIQAIFAPLSSPQGVALDESGNLYIADAINNRIRKVATNGIISTVAGNGTGGYSGDSGPATSAKLSQPHGVTVDAAGNLYIADTLNNRIRKVATNGTISTVAGNGTGGYSGDGGSATSAELYEPSGIAIDAAGNLYIADTRSSRIRKVATNGTISTVAGNGTGGYSSDGGPATSAELFQSRGVAIDAAGNLYIADTINYRIRKVTTNGTIKTVAGNGTGGDSGDGGPALSAELFNPSGVAIDATGNLYIADTDNNRIRVVPGDEIFKNGFQ